MANNIDLFLSKLRNLAKAHDRLSRGALDIKSSQSAADNALKEVLVLLDNPETSRILNKLIAKARDRLIGAPIDFDHELEARRSELIQVETAVVQQAGARKRDIEYLYFLYRDVQQHKEQFPSDSAALKQSIIDLHESTKAQLAESRKLSRKKKKKRKRKLGQGIASAIFGTGIIVADTQLPLLFVFSYGLGGGALHQALRDIVGESAE